MNIPKTRFLASLAFVAALLLGSAAHAGVAVTATEIDVWGSHIDVEWRSGDTTREKVFEADGTTPDGYASLQEAADHIADGGTAIIEWSINEAGLYEVDVTLK